MKEGRLVEVQNTETLFEKPQHAYTAQLLNLMPQLAQLRS